MTDNNNIDTEIDIEADGPEAPEEQKPSLKEVWESNPLLKVAAIILAGGVAYSAYALIFGGDKGSETPSVVAASSEQGVTAVGGGVNEMDPEYKKALAESNKREAEAAAQSGGSNLPRATDSARTSAIDTPDVSTIPVDDPLREWRRTVEARKIEVDDTREESLDLGIQQVEAVAPVQPVIRPQPAMQSSPEAAKALADQMRVIITAQAPLDSKKTDVTREDSLYVQQKKEEEKQKAAAAATSVNASGGAVAADGNAEAAKPKVIVPAGQIAYAQLLTELNSDVPGPALAQILSGPFEGGRALGKMVSKTTNNAEHIIVTFSSVVKDGVSYEIDGVALDEKTTLPALATGIDHHYFTRIILPAAAKFVEGYGKAAATTGTTVATTSGGGTSTAQRKPNSKEQVYKGLEESTKKISEILDKNADRPITIKVARGTAMGILFIKSVRTTSVK